ARRPRPPPTAHLPYPTLFRSRGEEGRSDIGGYHAGAFRQETAQRLRDEAVDLGGKEEQAQEYQQHGQQTVQQAGAQLGEVRDQRSEEHTSELQSRENLVCRLL